MTADDENYVVWLESKEIIADFLGQLETGHGRVWYDNNAGAILARLAHAGLLVKRIKVDTPQRQV